MTLHFKICSSPPDLLLWCPRDCGPRSTFFNSPDSCIMTGIHPRVLQDITHIPELAAEKKILVLPCKLTFCKGDHHTGSSTQVSMHVCSCFKCARVLFLIFQAMKTWTEPVEVLYWVGPKSLTTSEGGATCNNINKSSSPDSSLVVTFYRKLILK